ncbi:Trm112 family protein [Streptomyces sp. NPDC020875]|uniref:Trm112 family protein n=1 Tax=Streptomyces sp. NPDC020875 TaxID=3154898 RepID=UPI0033E1B5B1
MTPDDPLLAVLVCPLDKGPLRLVTPAASAAVPAGGALYNPRLRRLYPIVDGVPRLRPVSGEPVSEETHAALTGWDGADPGPAAEPGTRRP